jgi:hypothetical protein
VDQKPVIWVHLVVKPQQFIGVGIRGSLLFELFVFLLAPRSKGVVFLPGETSQIFNPGELTREHQMLFEIGEIACESLGGDIRDFLRPEDVSNALVLFVQFWHGSAP